MDKKEKLKLVIDSLTPEQIEEVCKIASIFSDRIKSLIKETVEALDEKGFNITYIGQAEKGENHGNTPNNDIE